MKEIHTIRMMIIILYIRKIINELLGNLKNLLPFKVWNAIREGISKCVICHNCH
jgi:hypothetical protein